MSINDKIDQRTVKKEAKKVIRKVMKRWRKLEVIDKKAFEQGLDIIIKKVTKQTGEPVGFVGQYTGRVLDGFAEDFEKVPVEERTHEDMIFIIYVRYLHHMGVLD
jgi:hypothetical protein